MRRAARASLLAIATALALGSNPARAATLDPFVVVFLVPGLSLDEGLAQPAIRALASRGGVGLMATPSHRPTDNSGYLSLGAGAVVEGSNDPVTASLGDEAAEVDLGGHVADDRDEIPGLLAEALARSGSVVTYVGEVWEPGRDLPGLLSATDRHGRVLAGGIHVDPDQRGGPSVLMFDLGRDPVALVELDRSVRDLPMILEFEESQPLFVVLVSPVPSSSMAARGDLAPALVVAEVTAGDLEALDTTDEPPRGLTSATTRRAGIVSIVDVAPTILEFLDVPIPAEMDGSPVRVHGRAPTELHQRFLEFRRTRVPIQAGSFVVALAVFLAAIALHLVGGPPRLRSVTAFLGLAVMALPAVLLPVGYLPSFSYGVLVPLVGGLSLGAAALARWAGRGDPVRPLVRVAWLAVALLVLDASLGWPGMMLSFLGGSALEGGRFYGLPNTYAGVLLGATVLAAARLPQAWGTALLVGAAILAGAPVLGANLGAGVALAAAAGLWWGTGTRERPGLRALALGTAAAVGALAVLLLWHRLAPAPTHVTRVVEEAERSGLAALAEAALGRLEILARNTSRIPVAWAAVAGLPVGLAIAWKGAGPIGGLLDRDPPWRRGAIVLALSGMVGFLVNDTSSTAAVGFAYLTASLLLPVLEAEWIEEPRPARG